MDKENPDMFRRMLFPLASTTVLLLGIDPAALLSGELRPADLACTSTGSVDVKTTVKGPLNTEIQLGICVRGSDPNRTFEVTNGHSKPITGCLSFFDANGDPVGDPQDLTVPAGGSTSGSMPSGATDWRFTDQPCDDSGSGNPDTDDSGVGGSGILDLGVGQQQQGKLRRRQYAHFFQGGPVDPDPFGRNVTYCLTVSSFDRDAAREMLEAVLTGSPATVPGVDGVEVHFYLESFMDVAGDLVMTFANDDVFKTLDLTLNGQSSYATLADGAPLATSNGWDAVRFLIPSRDLIYDPTPGALWRNDFDAAFSTAGDPGDSHFTGYFEFESD
jgi:hypothetical protein